MEKFIVQEGQGYCYVCGEEFVPTHSPEEGPCFVACSNPEHNHGYVFETAKETTNLRQGYRFL